MMETKYLMPGYTSQGFSCVRGKMFEGANEVEKWNKPIGAILGIPVNLLSKTTEYVEVPFRLVETVALGVINLIGAIFSEGCRSNLFYCAVAFTDAAFDTVWTLVILCPPILGMVAAFHIASSLFMEIDLHEKSYKKFIEFYRVSAIRTHGYEKIHGVEKEFSLKNSVPFSAVCQFYKFMSDLPRERFDPVFASLRAKLKNVEVPVQDEGWTCPQELKENTSPLAEEARNILTKYHHTDWKTLTKKSEIKPHLCELLQIPQNSDDKAIKKARMQKALNYHPDKNLDKPWANQVFVACNTIYEQYQTTEVD